MYQRSLGCASTAGAAIAGRASMYHLSRTCAETAGALAMALGSDRAPLVDATGAELVELLIAIPRIALAPTTARPPRRTFGRRMLSNET